MSTTHSVAQRLLSFYEALSRFGPISPREQVEAGHAVSDCERKQGVVFPLRIVHAGSLAMSNELLMVTIHSCIEVSWVASFLTFASFYVGFMALCCTISFLEFWCAIQWRRNSLVG